MKPYTLALVAILFTIASFAQADTSKSTVSPQPVADPSKKTNASPENISLDDDSTIFMKCEIEPTIDPYVWLRHQEKQVKKFLKASRKKQYIPSGEYKINVAVLIEKNGTVSDVQVLNDPGFGLADLARTICRTSPKWKPGLQNSHIVRAYIKKEIEFYVN